jgi:hypothetical protein
MLRKSRPSRRPATPSAAPAVIRLQPQPVAGKLTGRGSPRSLSRSLVLGCLVSLVAVGVIAPAANATRALHAFERSFGSAGAGAGQMRLRAPGAAVAGSAVAVNTTTGDVYVADTENHRIDEFEANGTFLRAWGWGVQNGQAKLQACTTITGCQAGISGTAPGQLNAPALLAVDNTSDASKGDIYVADTGDNLITKYTATGSLVETWGLNGQLSRSTSTGSANLTEGTTTLEDVTGIFSTGEEIEGEGIPTHTTITATPGGGTLEISNPIQAGKTGISITITAHRPLATLAGITITPTSTLTILNTANELFALEQNGTPVAPEIEVEQVGGIEPRGLAIDGPSNGFFEVRENIFGNHSVFEFTAEGEGVTEIEHVSADAIATDAGELFVAEAGVVKLFALPGSGEPSEPASEVFGSGVLEVSAGVAVDPALSNAVYVADASSGRVDVFAPEAVSVPLVVGESVSEVTDDSASFAGEVNPRTLAGEAATTYRFVYGACATASSCSSSGFPLSSPSGSLAASFEVDGVGLAQAVQGLQAGTTYHYKLVAGNSHGVGEGPEQSFMTTGAGAFVLPDARQWQMVSPPDKQGALIESIGSPGDGADGAVTQAAAAGDAVTYLTDTPTEAAPSGSDNFVQVFSARGADGWHTRDLTVPHMEQTSVTVGHGQEYRFFSEDLSTAAVQPFGAFTPCENAFGELQPCISPEASEQTSFLQDTQTGLFTPLVTGCPAAGACPEAVEEHADVPRGTVISGHTDCTADKPCGPGFVGGSPDLQHAVIAYAGLSEWSAGVPASEQLRQVSLLPPNAQGEVLEAPAPTLGFNDEDVRHAISEDGSRVIWEGGQALKGHLFLRLNATERQSATVGEHCTEPAMACTVEIGTGEFQDASREVTQVLYTSAGDLYAYNVQTESTVLLAEGVQGLVGGMGEDGSYVYYVAGDNLYMDHLEGALWQQILVAALSSSDAPDWGSSTGVLRNLTVRVPSDGRWLAFMSQRSLTGYDNADAVSGEPDEEVYLYHAAEHPALELGSLVCASCNPTGARPHGVEYGVDGSEAILSMPLAGGYFIWPGSSWLAANVPGWTKWSRLDAAYQSRYLSGSGRLFFNSSDALVGKDIDGAVDVYEYEPAGVPVGEDACSPGVASGSVVFEPEREVSPGVVEPAGCVGLISSGVSQESAFLDASESGGDVFFLTPAKLTVSDVDTALDVYDAHECTSVSPCLPAEGAVSPACDTEASCKAAPASQPEIFGPSGSQTFSGPGNFAPAVKPAVKPLTRAQLLTRALRSCRKDRLKRKRVACERVAKGRYGPVKKAKKSPAAKKSSSGSGVGDRRGK